MREVGGKMVPVQDRNHKVRKDYTIEDPDLIRQTQSRILRRIVPEILKVHQFQVTRMERHIVSCYAAMMPCGITPPSPRTAIGFSMVTSRPSSWPPYWPSPG
jgi:hypothetical protein